MTFIFEKCCKCTFIRTIGTNLLKLGEVDERALSDALLESIPQHQLLHRYLDKKDIEESGRNARLLQLYFSLRGCETVKSF